MHNWITLLNSKNWDNTVNQLYLIFFFKYPNSILKTKAI